MTALAGNQEDGVSFRVVFNSAAARHVGVNFYDDMGLECVLENAIDDELDTRSSRWRRDGGEVHARSVEKLPEGALAFTAIFNQAGADLLEYGAAFRDLSVEDYLKAVVGGYLDDRSPAWGVLGCAVQSVERVPPVGSCGAFSM